MQGDSVTYNLNDQQNKQFEEARKNNPYIDAVYKYLEGLSEMYIVDALVLSDNGKEMAGGYETNVDNKGEVCAGGKIHLSLVEARYITSVENKFFIFLCPVKADR